MDQFLHYICNLSVILQNNDNVHIVIGNESCDLDSTVSSLAFAYFLTNQDCENNSTIIPVLNIPLNEFPLRTENMYVLKKIGVDYKTLLYRDTINLKELQEKSNLKVTLVDHHLLSKEIEFLAKSVVQIFDHRPYDHNANWHNVEIKINEVGSCATLIADEIIKTDFKLLCKSLSTILYDTIIFDTIGLSPEAGKMKKLDSQVCEQLEQFLEIERSHNEMFSKLWEAHIDVSHLTPLQLLHKDLKIVDNILIPGLPYLVKHFLQQPGVIEDLKTFCVNKNCKIVVLMGLEAKDRDVNRDIAFYSVDGKCKLVNDIIDNIVNFKELELEENSSGITEIIYFKQNNSKPSRKQILPIIKKSLMKGNDL